MYYNELLNNTILVPQVIFENREKLSLSSTDILVIIQLLAFSQTKEQPKTSKICQMTGLSAELVTNSFAKLEEKKYLEIIQCQEGFRISLKGLFANIFSQSDDITQLFIDKLNRPLSIEEQEMINL